MRYDSDFLPETPLAPILAIVNADGPLHEHPVLHGLPARPAQARGCQHGQRGYHEAPDAVAGLVDLLDVHAEDGGGEVDGYEDESQDRHWEASSAPVSLQGE